MRLICPNCSAKYDVDGTVIPDAGREVKCSSCQHVWFQEPDADTHHRRADSTLRSSDIPASGITPRPALSDEVVNVLREEAEFENRARKEEENPTTAADEQSEDAALDPVDTDLADDLAGIDHTDESAAIEEEPRSMAPSVQDWDALPENAAALEEAPADASHVPAEHEVDTDPEQEPVTEIVGYDVEVTDEDAEPEHGQELPSELLPDIEQINSSLQSSSRSRRSGGGFRTGFLFSLLLIGGAVATYAYTPQIIEAWPDGEELLTSYVQQVDVWRYKLHTAVGPIF